MIIIFSLVFLLAAILMGVFITGTGMSEATHVRVGMRAIFLSYILGITLLVTAVILS